jgi:histidinol phosphatase-like enzyme (inositol monophosphatase family)
MTAPLEHAPSADSHIPDRLQLALVAAREAGEITLRYFRRDNFEVEYKADASPVTVADREAEQHLRRRISAAFPDDGIVGEEFPAVEGSSGFRWILDPIDGTKSFVTGVPLYGTLIGVEHEGQGVLGVVLCPGLDECVYACRGRGAWSICGGEPPQPARVSNRDRLAEAVFVTTEVRGFDLRGDLASYLELERSTRLTRTWGDCYGYMLVATGRADIMIDPVMNVWDAAAVQPIVEEAGGTFTDWKGQPTIHGGDGIATNGKLLADVLRIVRQARHPR